MVRRRRGRPLSCVFVADVGSWAVLSAMRAAVTVMWAFRTAAWAAGRCFGDGLTFPSPTMAGNDASRDRTDGVMEQRAAANLERSVPAAVGVLESGF